MKNILNVISIIIIILFFKTAIAQIKTDDFPLQYVNPFIGTLGWGHTFPGAVVPNGMVSVSPHSTFSNPSGYSHNEKYFYGFGHVHLSGVGCTELGSVVLTASRGEIKTDPDQYKTTYSNETASPGFYSLYLDEHKIKAEVSAAVRSGITKFITDEDGLVNLTIDAGRSLSLLGGGKVQIISDTEVEGYNISGAFCGEDNRETVFFSAKFNLPSHSRGTWIGDKLSDNTHAEIIDSSLGAWFSFNVKKSEPLLVKVGISYVSTENARLNRDKEIPHWDFNLVKSNAEQLWKENLSRIIVEGGSKGDLTIFYTAIYHTFIHPNIISDVNGEYPLMGRNGTGTYQSRKRYSIFSLWDTYRTLHPFMTLVFPELQSEFVQTMIDMYKDSGFLPKWELTGNETYMMVGDPASPVIADTYIKGIRDFDAETALEAMLKPVMLQEGEEAPPIRPGYHDLLQYKYIPFEQDWNTDWWVWGPASTTLEYNLSDWTIARLADELGKKEIAEELYIRSLYYKNLFDSTTQFIRPRMKDGSWLEPFDPLELQGSGDWSWSGGPGYVEGNAWRYTWFVPHDIPGLIELFGGKKPFTDKLYKSIKEKHFTVSNEPDIAYPYLFNYVGGEEYRTRELIPQIIRDNFSAKADGLPGDDDCGTISAWLVFSMLGFYPDCPASEYYQLGIPAFDKVTITLNDKYYPGEKFIIEKGKDLQEPYKEVKIFFNKKEVTQFKIRHDEIAKGGKLIFSK